jgi:hypothetical protein
MSKTARFCVKSQALLFASFPSLPIATATRYRVIPLSVPEGTYPFMLTATSGPLKVLTQ